MTAFFRWLRFFFFPGKRYLLSVLVVLLNVGCERSPEPLETKPTISAVPTLGISPAAAEDIAHRFWQVGAQTLAATQGQAEQLHQAIDALLAQPSTKTLAAAKDQWDATFFQYQQALPFLLIDDEDSAAFSSLNDWRFTLAAWPLQPGYLDSYGEYIQSGIVNDITVAITVEILRKQHGLTDAEEVTLGLHAMEFLLWNASAKNTFERFREQTQVPLALEQSGLKREELPNNRRRELLKLQAQLFADDMKTIVGLWQENAALALAFSQLDTAHKLFAINAGYRNYIYQVHELLVHHGAKDNADALYFDGFAGKRIPAISATLTAIRAFYAEKKALVSNESINPLSIEVSFSEALLTKENQSALNLMLKDASAQLSQVKDNDYYPIISTLNDIVLLLSTTADEKE
jgi:hypothetical protein